MHSQYRAVHSFNNSNSMVNSELNELGSIVTDYFVGTLKKTPGITPDIVLSKQGILATDNLTKMINSLTRDTVLYDFIKKNYNLPISVVS